MAIMERLIVECGEKTVKEVGDEIMFHPISYALDKDVTIMPGFFIWPLDTRALFMQALRKRSIASVVLEHSWPL